MTFLRTPSGPLGDKKKLFSFLYIYQSNRNALKWTVKKMGCGRPPRFLFSKYDIYPIYCYGSSPQRWQNIWIMGGGGLFQDLTNNWNIVLLYLFHCFIFIFFSVPDGCKFTWTRDNGLQWKEVKHTFTCSLHFKSKCFRDSTYMIIKLNIGKW